MKITRKELQDLENLEKNGSDTQPGRAGPRSKKNNLNNNSIEVEDEDKTQEEEQNKNQKPPVEENQEEGNEYQNNDLDLPGIDRENTRVTNAGQGKDASQGSEFLN